MADRNTGSGGKEVADQSPILTEQLRRGEVTKISGIEEFTSTMPGFLTVYSPSSMKFSLTELLYDFIFCKFCLVVFETALAKTS